MILMSIMINFKYYDHLYQLYVHRWLNMRDKHPIHTTLSTDAMKILERYEIELGTKNTVLERALLEWISSALKRE